MDTILNETTVFEKVSNARSSERVGGIMLGESRLAQATFDHFGSVDSIKRPPGGLLSVVIKSLFELVRGVHGNIPGSI